MSDLASLGRSGGLPGYVRLSGTAIDFCVQQAAEEEHTRLADPGWPVALASATHYATLYNLPMPRTYCKRCGARDPNIDRLCGWASWHMVAPWPADAEVPA